MPIQKVGDGATQHYISFRRPYTIIKVFNDWHVRIQRDMAVLVSGNDRAGNAVYEFKRNPLGEILDITRRKENGVEVWRIMGKSTGSTFTFGERAMWDDPEY